MRSEDGDRARQLLRAHGYVELRNVEENRKYLFRRFHRGEEMIGLHVHTHVGWYASFLDEETLWQRRRPSPDDPAVTIPSPEDILLVTLAHAFYEDKCIKVSDLVKVHQCLRAASRFDWAHIERVADLRGWPDGLAVALLVCAHLGDCLVWRDTDLVGGVGACGAVVAGRSLVGRAAASKTGADPRSLPAAFCAEQVLFLPAIMAR